MCCVCFGFMSTARNPKRTRVDDNNIDTRSLIVLSPQSSKDGRVLPVLAMSRKIRIYVEFNLPKRRSTVVQIL